MLWVDTNNESHPSGIAASQRVPLAASNDNQIKIVHTFWTAANGACILLVTPPYVDDAVQTSHARQVLCGVERANDAVGKHARLCIDVAWSWTCASWARNRSFTRHALESQLFHQWLVKSTFAVPSTFFLKPKWITNAAATPRSP